jgi:hypothetical protein
MSRYGLSRTNELKLEQVSLRLDIRKKCLRTGVEVYDK